MKIRGSKRESSTAQIVAYVIFSLVSLVCVLPIVLMAIASFTDNDTLNLYGYSFFPEEWSLEAYEFLLKQSGVISTSFFNSIFVTFAGTILGLSTTVLLAYAISRRDLIGRRALMFFVFFTMLFNGGMVPTYLMYIQLFDIKNTYWALLFPHLLVNGFNILLVRTFFANNVPEALLEAARIDGAGELRTFLSVVLPISKPILATVGLLIGVGYWNDWYNGLLFVTEVPYYTLQNFLNKIMMDLQFLSPEHVGHVGCQFHHCKRALQHSEDGNGVYRDPACHCDLPVLPKILYKRHCRRCDERIIARQCQHREGMTIIWMQKQLFVFPQH